MIKPETRAIRLSKPWGVIALLFSLLMNTQAGAVRPAVVNLSANGQIPGGYYETSGAGAGRLYLGSVLADSSADGNLVVFTSTNPPSVFTPEVVDLFETPRDNVFVRNIRSGQVVCVSCRTDQGVTKGWGGTSPRITPNGRYVVYSGLNRDEPSPFFTQVYRVDLQTGEVKMISANAAGVQGNSHSVAPVISDDGRYVAFTSISNNLVDNYPMVNSAQVFLKDLNTGQVQLASHAINQPAQPGDSSIDTTQPLSISANGRYVVWTSAATNYVPFITDANAADDVFYFDAQFTGFNIHAASLNLSALGTANASSSGGQISADTDTSPPSIIFASNATDLNTADTNSATDIYCIRNGSGAQLVSIARDGSSANGASAAIAGLSRSGRFAVFSSNASNLVTGVNEANSSTGDVFIRDLDSQTTRYASLNSAGQASATATGATLGLPPTNQLTAQNVFLNKNVSNDGRFVTFVTAEPLNVRDSGSTLDVYVRDLTAGMPVLASLNQSLSGGQNSGFTPRAPILLVDGGRKVGFSTFATNLTANDTTTVQNSKAYMARVTLLAQRSNSDMNGDNVNDFVVFRPAEGVWYSLMNGADGGFDSVVLGENGNRIVPGDYDGDGRLDQGVFSPAAGRWDLLRSSNQMLNTTFFGVAGDLLAPADYDGDGRTDLAFFRPASGNFYIMQSNSNSLRSLHFGTNGDIPVAGDFDGDNRADVAVFRPSTGDWYVLASSTNTAYGFHWGLATDKPVTGDFDGDGKSDAAVYRGGVWYILNSRDGSYRALPWGLTDDRPVVSDYDGDRVTDIAVFRPSNGTWYILRSGSNSLLAAPWGAPGDIPAPAAYVP